MYSSDCYWGKGNTQTFQGLLKTELKFTLIANNQKLQHGLCMGMRAFRGQVISEVLVKVMVHWVCELTWYSFPWSLI